MSAFERCRCVCSIRALLAVLLSMLGGELFAQSPSSQPIYTGNGATDTFLSANPGARLLSVDQSGAVYKTSKGYTLITGPGVTAYDGSSWQIAKPQISTDGNGGWVQTGAPAQVAITGKDTDKHLKVTQGSSVLDLLLSGVAYVSGQEFSFQSGGATWRLLVVPRGHEFETTVQTASAPRTGRSPTSGPASPPPWIRRVTWWWVRVSPPAGRS